LNTVSPVVEPMTAAMLARGRGVLAALFLSGFMLFGGGLYYFVLLVPVLTDAFHWSRAATGGLVSTFWLAAPVALLGGVLLRRFGPRTMLATGVVIEATCLLIFATTSSLPVMYLLRALMGLGKVLYAVTIPVLVARWFRHRFALGCAVAWSGWHVGGLVLSWLGGVLLEHYSWRATCVVVALGMFVVGLVPALLAIPRESVRTAEAPDAGAAHSAGDMGIYRQLLTSRFFWIIAAGTVCCWFVYSGTLAHQAALIEESGVTAHWASLALSSTAAFAALGTLGLGWLADRWSLTWVGILEHGLLATWIAGLLLFAHTGSPLALFIHVACFGAAIGGCDIFWTTLLKYRVGERTLAYGYGVWYFFVVITLLIAPVVAGHLYDLSGSYTTAVLVLLGAAVAAGVIGFSASPPAKGPRAAAVGDAGISG
jgi:OFA family oxalate/formate antiporter-like MFS transporter